MAWAISLSASRYNLYIYTKDKGLTLSNRVFTYLLFVN